MNVYLNPPRVSDGLASLHYREDVKLEYRYARAPKESYAGGYWMWDEVTGKHIKKGIAWFVSELGSIDAAKAFIRTLKVVVVWEHSIQFGTNRFGEVEEIDIYYGKME